MLSLHLLNIFFAAIIIVVLQRFAADPVSASNFVCVNDALKGEGSRPGEEGTLEMVRQAVWEILYADDGTSPRGLARMIDVLVVACQEFGRTVSEKKTEARYLWSDPSTASNALRFEAAGQRYR